MTLYVNNVSEGTGSKASDYSLTNTEAFGTGRYRSGGDANYFDGIIDEVAFWNRAITTDEISEIYNSGTGKFYNDWDLVTFIPFIMMS